MTLQEPLVAFADRFPFVDRRVDEHTVERNISGCLLEPLFDRGPPGGVVGRERIDEFGKFRRRTHPRREMEGVTIEAKYVSEFCLAEASGVPQQSFEYGLEPPG